MGRMWGGWACRVAGPKGGQLGRRLRGKDFLFALGLKEKGYLQAQDKNQNTHASTQHDAQVFFVNLVE